MRQELIHILEVKYPFIVPQGVSIACGDGWFNLLDNFCHSLMFPMKKALDEARCWEYLLDQGCLENEGISVEVMAWEASYRKASELLGCFPRIEGVSSVLGLLVIRLDRVTEASSMLLDFVEGMSLHICESCGNLGHIQPTRLGWMCICNHCKGGTV